MSLPVRSVAVTRRPRVARASAGLAASRLLAAGAVLGAAAALYGATSSDAFRLDRLDVSGTRRASEAEVRAVIEQSVGEHPNLFRIRTDELAGGVSELPQIRSAEVRVVLPDRLVVVVTEREPILVWSAGRQPLLVDAEGRVVADADGAETSLPFVEDLRQGRPALAVGGRLDPTDLTVVRQLGALTPTTLGSRARRLQLAVDDRDGWTITAEPSGWRAVFGVYAARIRTPEVVPTQVQCLASVIAAGEARLAVVYLAPTRDRCGTFRARED